MKLYDYFRSSAAYRVRIALNLKGLEYQQAAVNLLKGEESNKTYRTLNPQGLVPSLLSDDGLITQSLAICEYLDEAYPEPPLLPGSALERSRTRALALAVACDIHPLNNLRVLAYITGELGASEEQKLSWYRHWITEGFNAIEALLADSERSGAYSRGPLPTLADVFLVPQVYNARRFELDLTPYPNITRIERQCLKLEAFDRARPENQPDAA